MADCVDRAGMPQPSAPPTRLHVLPSLPPSLLPSSRPFKYSHKTPTHWPYSPPNGLQWSLVTSKWSPNGPSVASRVPVVPAVPPASHTKPHQTTPSHIKSPTGPSKPHQASKRHTNSYQAMPKPHQTPKSHPKPPISHTIPQQAPVSHTNSSPPSPASAPPHPAPEARPPLPSTTCVMGVKLSITC
ncbi:leucine-rich repeat extensin-like protein 3 [Portunus trituberculatus]|uniref:leucine-rich repeat extensin-like protein 3 n=1 Tax=Portunus trituberculatus TaxID=210409 RepID=UPI001E1D017F|nr:leucine-rich repeat extensin-like protein 3 [Portunus trituberculatus]